MELEESVVSAVLKSVPVPPQGSGSDDSLVKVPSEGEVRIALNMMKNGRAPGADGISAELLKLDGEKVVQWLLHFARVTWEEEKVLEDWLKQLTVPLHKKGSLKECDNYRGIALLSVPGKVFCQEIQ